MAFFDVLSFVFEWCCFSHISFACDMLRIVELLNLKRKGGYVMLKCWECLKETNESDAACFQDTVWFKFGQ